MPADARAHERHGHQLSLREVRAAANDLQILAADIHFREPQFIGIWMFGERHDLSHDNFIELGAAIIDMFDRRSDERNYGRELIGRLLHFHVFAQPFVRNKDVHRSVDHEA